MAETFDYVIVGAGSAGCVLANRLSEDGRNRVLLIEAGAPDSHLGTRMPLGFMAMAGKPGTDWGYVSEPEPGLGGRRVPLPRGRMLGGCSSINGMIYMRGHARDYDEWAALGCVGWSHDDVLPYFRRMESSWRGAGDRHGGSGPLPVREVRHDRLMMDPIMASVRAAGHCESGDLSVVQEGFASCEVTIDARGRRASTSRVYLRPARSRPNLAVITDATVTRVILEGTNAVGVAYRHQGREIEVRAGREVILSGGAYNSPKLLMLSGIGPAGALRAHGIVPIVDLPGVGANLSEHPMVYVEFAISEPTTFLHQLRFDRAALSTLRWALLGTGPFATQVTSCAVMLRTDPALGRPDIQLMFLPIRLDARLWFPGIRKRQRHLISVMVIQLHPEGRGRVELASAEPDAPPAIRLGLLSNERDRADLRRGIDAVRAIFAEAPLAGMTAGELKPGADRTDDAALDAFLRDHVRITQHPVGTCSMGVGPDAVTDPQLRVVGVDGLRVVDASIMPRVPGGNTNAAVIMVAEKAADMILGRPPLSRERTDGPAARS